MRKSRSARVASRAALVCALSLSPSAVQAEKSLVRRFPVPKWCSIISGFDTHAPLSDHDLLNPYTFDVPAGQSKVTLIFTADNRNAQGDKWNGQRLDNVIVLRSADLPSVFEGGSCFNELEDPNGDPVVDEFGNPIVVIPPIALPSLAVPALFRDDFATGARPEWGIVPPGDVAGAATAPVFWSPTGADASGGSLGLGRSNRVSGALVDQGPVVARLNLTGLTAGLYAVMAYWDALEGTPKEPPTPGVTTFLTISEIFDSVTPTNPALNSPSHSPNVWSGNPQVAVSWSGAVDNVGGTGLAGYSTVFDTSPGTVPDSTVDTPQATDPHSFVTATLADGGSYYFHLRTCDLALNCSGTVHLGPFKIDRTAPGTVGALTSTSHTVGVTSSDSTIDMTWTPATDASAGVDGYGYVFDHNPTWACDQAKDAEEGTTGTTSPSLGAGTWYFHVCTRDNAGNWSAVASAGPYTIGGAPSGLRLNTLTPCRLVDTRNAIGPLGGPSIGAGVERTFLATLACGVPATATALSVNITVVSPTTAGDLRLYAGGGPAPLASVINFSSGQVRANNAILPLSGSHEFSVFSDQPNGTVHLIVDVNGYFE